jgi:hypothetical protein
MDMWPVQSAATALNSVMEDNLELCFSLKVIVAAVAVLLTAVALLLTRKKAQCWILDFAVHKPHER